MKKSDETSNADSYFTTKINSLRQEIPEAKDYPLYDEVVKCLSGGANRAAYILTWICIAESLRNKFVAMSTRDAEIGKILAKIEKAEQDERPTDRILLDNADKVGIISSVEQIKLDHIRVMRNIYAHPTGSAPNLDEVLARSQWALTLSLEDHRSCVTATLTIFSSPFFRITTFLMMCQNRFRDLPKGWLIECIQRSGHIL